MNLISLATPLITYPYLIFILGAEKYGLIIFAQAIIGYFTLIINFGFNITATKEISENRYNPSKLNSILSSIYTLKGILLIISLSLFLIVCSILPQAKEHKLLFYLSAYLCFNEWLFPIWFFQGIEKMKHLAITNVINRTAVIILIFIFIKSDEDYLIHPIINAISLGTGLAYIFYIMFVKHKLKIVIPKKAYLKRHLLEAIPIFLSNLSVKFYLASNRVVIGSFIGITEVTYYDIAEKLISIARIPQSLLSQTLFPKISLDKDKNFIRKISNYSVGLNFFFYVVLLTSARQILLILSEEEVALRAWPIVLILGITLPLTAMSNIFGIQLLIPFGFNKLYGRIIIYSGVFYFLILTGIWYISTFTLMNLSVLTLLVEIFVTSTMYWFCRKNNLW